MNPSPPHFLRFVLVLVAASLVAPPAHAEGERDIRRSKIVKAVERTRGAVVSIRTNQVVPRRWYGFMDREPSEREGGLGSGVIFHPDGFVITNAHVIAQASRIFVTIPGNKRAGASSVERVGVPLAVDLQNDLAILRLLPPDRGAAPAYPYLRLARSDDLMLGETVIAMGHPFRLGLTVTQGIVSGTHRKLKMRSNEFRDFLQLDAAINPGNSGGPLLDVTGRWVAVNTAIYNRVRTNAEGIGFAIPAARVRDLIARAFKRRLMSNEWFGLEMQAAGSGAGAIKHIYPTGPARDTALRTKDRVLAVNGKPTKTLFDVRMELVRVGGGQTVTFDMARAANGERYQARVSLKPLPTDTLSEKHLGFVARDTDAFDGVLVADVRQGGPSDSMGLKKNHIIVGLGPWSIKNSEDLLLFLQNVKPGDVVKVWVKDAAWRGVQHGELQAE